MLNLTHNFMSEHLQVDGLQIHTYKDILLSVIRSSCWSISADGNFRTHNFPLLSLKPLLCILLQAGL